jgi:wyosine [tRNA(Phe)-imidazoG37] synthetase (radical SAM superfamily)
MKYVFGPVPSRRLGRSLGIDPTPSASVDCGNVVGPNEKPCLRKACNWNCVYCQLGRTKPFTRTRASFFPPAEMLTELRGRLEAPSPVGVDWITFVGSGEPTLNSDLGVLLRGVKSISELPVAVITNGSLLSLPGMRKELEVADAVMPTLDAGSAPLFKRINRPPAELSFSHHLEGLISFRKAYSGKLWLEVMLIAGLNDDEESLRDLAAAIARISPDEVHLLLPTRPPAEDWVRPADEEGLRRASSILGEVALVLQPNKGRGIFGNAKESDPFAAAAAILARHPMSLDELSAALSRWGVADPGAIIRSLVASDKAIEIERGGVLFLQGR